MECQIVRPSNTPEIVRAFKRSQSENRKGSHRFAGNTSCHGSCCKPQGQAEQNPAFQSITEAAAASPKRAILYYYGRNGAIRANASEVLTEFATQLNIPVANTFMGKGVILYSSQLCGQWDCRDYISCGFDNTDLVIAIGYDLIEYSRKVEPDGIPIIHIGITPAEIDSSHIPMVKVGIFPIPSILRKSDRQGKPEPYALELRADIQADYEQYAKDDAFPIKPQIDL